jgi:hypothetical protein
VHGIRLDTERAEQVAERLTRTPNPSFADFFPDGRVALREPSIPQLAAPQRALPVVEAGLRPVGPAVA